MSQLVLDDHLDAPAVLLPIRKWITAQFLRHLRPGQQILDDRVPQLLRTLRQPTFVTIDRDFWDSRWCNPSYGILYFALEDTEQELLPDLLRALFRRPEFRTRADRMGKVAKVSTVTIEYWDFPTRSLQRIAWQGPRRSR